MKKLVTSTQKTNVTIPAPLKSYIAATFECMMKVPSARCHNSAIYRVHYRQQTALRRDEERFKTYTDRMIDYLEPSSRDLWAHIRALYLHQNRRYRLKEYEAEPATVRTDRQVDVADLFRIKLGSSRHRSLDGTDIIIWTLHFCECGGDYGHSLRVPTAMFDKKGGHRKFALRLNYDSPNPAARTNVPTALGPGLRLRLDTALLADNTRAFSVRDFIRRDLSTMGQLMKHFPELLPFIPEEIAYAYDERVRLNRPRMSKWKIPDTPVPTHVRESLRRVGDTMTGLVEHPDIIQARKECREADALAALSSPETEVNNADDANGA